LQAVTLLEPGHVAITDRPEPRCGPTDVIVEMHAVGLCGSDLSVFDGSTVVPEYPWVLGHEGGGEVVAVGSEVTNWRVGQLAVIEPNICCFGCGPCKAGTTSSCTARRALGITEPGIASERVSVPAAFCWPVDDGIAPIALASVEPYAVARTAVRRSGIRQGDRCLVIGAGSQGLLVCAHLLSLGVETFVVEPHEGRLRLAETLGARPHQPDSDTYLYVFETSGAETAFRMALDATSVTGRVILIGQNRYQTTLASRELVQRQITVSGSLIYDHPQDFATTVEACQTHADELAAVMAAAYKPAEAHRAFTEARNVAGKSWLDLTSGWTR
jgi:alcohol dehydrogenase/L-iditol 2-dehydrogenase